MRAPKTPLEDRSSPGRGLRRRGSPGERKSEERGRPDVGPTCLVATIARRKRELGETVGTPVAVSSAGVRQALVGNTVSAEVALVIIPDDGAAPRISTYEMALASVGAAAALPTGGFLVVGIRGGDEAAAWLIREGGATETALPVTIPSGRRYGLTDDDPNWSLTGPDASARYVAVTSDADRHVIAIEIEIETTTTAPTIRLVDTGEMVVGTTPHLAVARGAAGLVVVSRVEAPEMAVRVTWLDDALATRSRVELPLGEGWVDPMGLVPGERDLVAFTWFGPAGTIELRVAAAHPSRHVSGGARALLSLPESDVRPVAWGSTPGAISVANASGTLEVVTLCAEP